MAKITVAAGSEDPSCPGNSSSPSDEKPSSTAETKSDDAPAPAPTMENLSEQDPGENSTARSTVGGTKASRARK